VLRTVCCFACVISLVGSVALAEVLELEGTIKAIDQEARSVSIVRQTPKGEKVLDLEIAKNAGDISGLKAGDSVSFSYNPDVDVISKIEKGLSDEAAAVLRELEGVWKVVAEHEFGKTLSKEEMRTRNRHITIKGDAFSTDRVINGTLGTYSGTIKVEPANKAFDFAGKGPGGKPVAWIGIYKVDGDSLALCYRINNEGTPTRPAEFKSLSEKPGTIMFECKREE
jgi:uncharacterized protein (TIGR03067 family)